MNKKNVRPPIPDWAIEHAKKAGWKQSDSSAVQGGFSNEVYNSKPVQDYFLKQWPVYGYIGAHTRSAKRDRELETLLREKFKLTPAKIGIFLISSDGRDLADKISLQQDPWNRKNHLRRHHIKLLRTWTTLAQAQ